MSQLDFLRIVVEVLRSQGIDHMLVGSYASSYHGESRSTHDVDLVVDLPPEKIHDLVAAFDRDRYYLSESAFRERRMANIIDTLTGDKVDIFFLKDDEDSAREFQRRRPGTILDIPIDIATAEDVILSKLRWEAQLGGSDRQRNDIRNILKLSANRLDISYIKRHAKSTLATLESLLEDLDHAEGL